MGVHSAMRFSTSVEKLVAEELARLHSDAPALLYHYTSQEGLLGIIQSSGLFLSDARFVNDASEISYGRDVFVDRLRRYIGGSADTRGKTVWKHFTEASRARLEKQWEWSFDHFYVASFCTEGNLLSQWRAYSGA